MGLKNLYFLSLASLLFLTFITEQKNRQNRDTSSLGSHQVLFSDCREIKNPINENSCSYKLCKNKFSEFYYDPRIQILIPTEMGNPSYLPPRNDFDESSNYSIDKEKFSIFRSLNELLHVIAKKYNKKNELENEKEKRLLVDKQVEALISLHELSNSCGVNRVAINLKDILPYIETLLPSLSSSNGEKLKNEIRKLGEVSSAHKKRLKSKRASDLTSALEDFCSNKISWEDQEYDEQKAKLRKCLKGRVDNKRTKDIFSFLKNSKKTIVDILASEKINKDAYIEKCLSWIGDNNTFYLMYFLEDYICQGKSDNEINDLIKQISLLGREHAKSCWQISSINYQGCLVFKSCEKNKLSKTADLPFQVNGAKPFEQEVVYCQSNLQKAHLLKDSLGMGQEVHLNSILNFIDKKSVGATFNPSNCHGNASIFNSGDNLARALHNSKYITKSNIKYMNKPLQNECATSVDKILKDLQEKSSFKDLLSHPNVKWEGITINMLHGDQCPVKGPQRGGFDGSQAKGEVSLNIKNCDPSSGEIILYTHADGLCDWCYFSLLGLQKFESKNLWKDLRAGCLLMADDHTITYLYQNNGICYFYETEAPFSSSHVTAVSCPQMWMRYDKKYCPRQGNGFFK